MRVTHFLLLIAITLLVVLGRPDQAGQGLNINEVQKEEARPQKTNIVLGEEVLFPVTMEIADEKEEPFADILWLKQAAHVALQNGTPYFNVVEQRVSRKFNREKSMRLSVIDGIIELDDDPMEAEYDANEIKALMISDFVE